MGMSNNNKKNFRITDSISTVSRQLDRSKLRQRRQQERQKSNMLNELNNNSVREPYFLSISIPL